MQMLRHISQGSHHWRRFGDGRAAGFARIMWDTWSPLGWFDERTFLNVTVSFANPDWAAVTNHSYRSRWGEAAFDPRSVKIETKIKTTKSLNTPTVFFHGALDGFSPPAVTERM